MVHSPYKLFPNETLKDFPIHYSHDNYNFVGCYIFADDSRVEKHHKNYCNLIITIMTSIHF